MSGYDDREGEIDGIHYQNADKYGRTGGGSSGESRWEGPKDENGATSPEERPGRSEKYCKGSERRDLGAAQASRDLNENPVD